MLEELQREHAVAPFFVIGANAKDDPDTVRTLYNAGMQIGNHGEPAERIMLLFNASDVDLDFKLPETFPCGSFQPMFDSTRSNGLSEPSTNCVKAGEAFPLPSRSFVLLQHNS